MKIKFLPFFVLVSVLLISCGSTPESDSDKKEAPVVEETPVEIVDDSAVDFDDDVVEVVDDVVQLYDEDEEYLRSTNDVNDVSKEEFNEDKAAILKIIGDLSKAMGNNDYEKIKSYISPASIEYYSNVSNLRKVMQKLPNKSIQLKGFRDYLKYVFIPARNQSNVDEIRYESKYNTKAVEVKEDGSLVVYYNFVKIKNKWMVSIPEL